MKPSSLKVISSFPSKASRRVRGVTSRVLSVALAALLCAALGIPGGAFGLAGGRGGPSPETAFAAASEGGAGEDTEPTPQLVEVPSTVGYTVSDAAAALQAAGFVVQIAGDSTATSLVAAQSPSGGQAALGSTVVITGQEQLVSVPYVVGADAPSAVATLQSAGFVVNVTGDSTATSLVMSQDPTGQVMPGTTITLVGQEFAEPEQVTLKQIDLLAYTTDSSGQWVGAMGTTSLGGTAYQVNDGIKEKGGKIRLMVQASWSDGRMFKQSDAGWLKLNDSDDAVRYTTSDASIATVDASGVVTAVADGEAIITATAPNGLVSTMAISIIGQNGAYVTGAQVTDETGEPYGTTYIDIFDIKDGSRTFYVRATYSDGTTACNAPRASDYSAEGAAAIAAACTWSITSSDVGSVNAASGTFVPKMDGRAMVIAAISGGDPSVGGGIVQASVSINVNTGKYEGGNAPSSQLKIEVEYEEMPGVIGKEVTLSIGELQAIENATCTYTLTRSDSQYVTDTAQGIYLSTLLDHVSIATSDVAYFKFAANDGANPGAVTSSFLFGYTRYYYPFANWGSDQGAVAVAPMLAFADSWKEGGTCEPSTELNSGTCLRLLFGSTGMADNSTSYSLKFINTMKVVLTGTPPVDWGKGETGGGGDPEGDNPNNGKPEGDNPNNGKPSGDKDGGNKGDGNKENSNEVAAGAIGSDTKSGGSAGTGTPEPVGSGEQGATEQTEASSSEEASGNEADSAPAEGGDAGGARWQVYEMMAKTDSDMEAITMENPLEPYVVPLAVAVLAAGAATTGVRFRRRLGLTWTPFSSSPPATA